MYTKKAHRKKLEEILATHDQINLKHNRNALNKILFNDISKKLTIKLLKLLPNFKLYKIYHEFLKSRTHNTN